MTPDIAWPSVPLTEICRPRQWKTISLKELEPTGYPVYGANGKIGFYKEYNHAHETVLITCRGATCGTLNICEPQSYVTGNAMALDELSERVDLKFLFYTLRHRGFDDVISGSAQPQITGEGLRKVKIPIPRLSQQHRIVAELDNLLDRSQAARAELTRVPKLVERYKQSVLAAAFSGDLTADWRALNCVKEDAVTMVRRVLMERRSYLTAGGGHTSRRGRYQEPQDPDWHPKLELPDSWAWASVDQLTKVMQYGTSAKTNDESTGVPVLRMGNIVRGVLQINNLKYLPNGHDEFPSLLLDDGDILFNRTNSPELVGKTAVFYSELPTASFASYLIRLKAHGVLPGILSAYINSPYGREWVRSVVSQQVGQANVNGTKLSRLAVPLMPKAEQVVLDKRLREMMATIDKMEWEVIRANAMLSRLDRSIFDRALRGDLDSQSKAKHAAAAE